MSESNKRIVAIHQPNLFPWLGYFHKILHCDTFIILDHVTNNPRRGIWTRRVKLMIHGKERWWSLPLKKPEELFQPINEMCVNDTDSAPLEKLRSEFHQSYEAAPYYSDAAALVDAFFIDPDPLIASRNRRSIGSICQALGGTTSFALSSTMDYSTTAVELLPELIRHVDGKEYLCGGGADGYMDNAVFKAQGIQVRYQDFKHPRYEQFNTDSFVPGLSILDAIANLGFARVEELLKQA
jgi:hypothetical protein